MPFDPATATLAEPGVKKPFDPETARRAEVMDSMGDPSQDPMQISREQDAIKLRTNARRDREQFLRDNVQPGVPLDLDAGLPASTRARLSFENDIDKQAEILTKGGRQVRKSKDGTNLIVRDGDKELLLHPKTSTLTGGDVAGATFPLAKAAAATGIAMGTGGLSLLEQAAVMGGGMALAHGAGRRISREAAGQDLDEHELGGEMAGEAAINTALPLADAAVKGGANLVRKQLLKGAGELEKRLPAAAARLGVPTTPAETSGSPAVAKLGRLTPEEETARQGALRASQDRAIGLSGRNAVLAESEIAGKAQPIFSDAAQAEGKAVREGLTDAEKVAQAQIQAQLDSGLVPTNLTNSEAGSFIRGKFEKFEQGVKDAAAKNYPAFHERAAEEGIVLNKKPITDLVAQIEKEDPTGAAELLAPSIKQVKNVESALTKPLQAATPPKRVGFTVEPGTPEVPAPDLTFQDAIRLRSIVRTKLNSPTDPLGDVVKSYYGRLEKALTNSIDDGLARGTPELRTLYDTARGSYAAGADALDRGIVQKLFRGVGESGRVPDEDVVRQLFSGKGELTALQDMKNILGPADFKLLSRAGLNDIISDAKAGGEMVDASKFLNRINGLDEEVRREVLGGAEKGLRETATLMKRAQGAKVPADELEDALASGSSAGKLLKRAIEREDLAQRTFDSTVQKRLRDGVLDARTANDDHFVSWLMSDRVPLTDTRQALAQIATKSPELTEQIRQRVLTNVLDEVGAKAPLGKITTGIADSDVAKLAAKLKGSEREKLQAAVGAEGIQFLEDLATYAEATAKRQVNEAGRHVSPETLMKETGSAALGFRRNAVGALVDVAAPVGRALGGGKVVRSEAFKRWLETGELPTLSKLLPGALGRAAEKTPLDKLVGVGVLSSPEGVRAQKALSEGKDRE